MKSKGRPTGLVLISCWLGLAPTLLLAEIDPKAGAIVKRLTSFYRTERALTADAEMTLSVRDPRGQAGHSQTLKQQLRLNRPGQMALVSGEGGALLSSPSVYLDGGMAAVKLDGQGWIRVNGIKGAGDLFKKAELGYDENVGGNLLFDQNLALSFLNKLLFPEVGAGWEKDLKSVRYVDEAELGGQKAHHLVLGTETQQLGEAATMDLHIWVAQGVRPFLLKIEPDMSKLFRETGRGAQGMDVSMVGVWSNWNANPKFNETSFAPPKPDEGEPVFGSFDELMQAQMASQNPALSLTGTQAAGFELPLLGGGKFSLAEQRDKNLTVISFWTTWLSDEETSIDALERLQKATKGKAIAVVAVNVGEPSDKVQAYAGVKGLSVPIVLDEQQSLVPPYRLRSVPQTVVVGPDGEIKQVHIGVDDAFEKELLEQVQTLLGSSEETSPEP